MKNSFRILAAVGALALSGVANAGFILSTAGATNEAVPAFNDFKGQLAGEGVSSFWDGAQLWLQGEGTLTIDYFGREAGYTNRFYYQNVQQFVSTSTANNVFGLAGTKGPYDIGSGLVPFKFCTSGGGGGCVANGSNTNWRSRTIGIALTSKNVAWLLWDDSGADRDDNHDDMVVRLTFHSVPEPATTGLLGLGLLALGLAVRRRKAG